MDDGAETNVEQSDDVSGCGSGDGAQTNVEQSDDVSGCGAGDGADTNVEQSDDVSGCGPGYGAVKVPPPGSPKIAQLNKRCQKPTASNPSYCCPTCPICMDPLALTPRTILECDHEFHTECWHTLNHHHVAQEGTSPACPTCRRDAGQRFADFVEDEAAFPLNENEIDTGPVFSSVTTGGIEPNLDVPVGHVEFPLPPADAPPRRPSGALRDTPRVAYGPDAAANIRNVSHGGIDRLMRHSDRLATRGYRPFSYLDFNIQLLTSSPVTVAETMRLTHEVETFFITDLTMDGVYIRRASMPGPTLDYRAVLALPNAHISQIQNEYPGPGIVSIDVIIRRLAELRFGDQLSAFSMDPPRMVVHQAQQ
jgi:hypothetical protein